LEAPVPPVAEAPAATVLAAYGVSKHWKGQDSRVLHGVELDLPAGGSVWLSGSNGAGKTTLLRILAGIIAPDEGLVLLGGLDPRHDRREFYRRLGLLSAGDRGLYPRLTVTAHLRLWARLARLERVRRRDAVDDALARFGLTDIARRRVDRLSMGQRQRLRIALTFLHQPSVVLLDEPLNSLDDTAIALLDEAMTALLAQGGACLWVSPAGDERAPLPVTEQLRLDAGRLVAC
jgi:ABC-2 type transport system ATP-binding protein